MNDVAGLSAGGIFAVLVIREVFNFIKWQRKSSTKSSVETPEMDKVSFEIRDLCRDLHEMHDVKDGDGSYIWYVKRSLGESIEKLAASIDRQSHAFNKLAVKLKVRSGD